MLNRHNLAIASIVPKDDDDLGRGVYVTKDVTYATDGAILVVVSTSDIAMDDIPIIDGIKPSEDPTPFIIPAKIALDVAKAIPRNAPLPILNHAYVESNGSETVKIAVTDLGSPRLFTFTKPAGNMPNHDRVMPKKEDAELCVIVDAEKLISVLKLISPVAKKDFGSPVAMRFEAHDKQFRIDAVVNDGEQTATGVIMPMSAGRNEEPHSFPRRKVIIDIRDGGTVAYGDDVDITLIQRFTDGTTENIVCKPDINKSDDMPDDLRSLLQA